MPEVALVTGGGRGIGAGIARELAAAGMRVAVSARTREQVEATAREIGGLAIVADVADRESVQGMVEEVERELGPIDLLVANAGIGAEGRSLGGRSARLVAHLRGQCPRRPPLLPGGDSRHARARARPDRDHGQRRRLPPGGPKHVLPGQQAAVHRYAETLANELEGRIPVFAISPGLVRTEMTEGHFPDDAPWTPPDLAPRLVRELSSGKLDRLSGRYIHAEHDDPDDLAGRADEILANDLNSIRLRR